LKIRSPLQDNYDNILGTLICALGNATDLQIIEGLPDLQGGQSSRTLNSSMDLLKLGFSASLSHQGEDKQGFQKESVKRILGFVQLQASIYLRRNLALPAEFDQHIRSSHHYQSGVGVQFHKNILMYRDTEVQVAKNLQEHLSKNCV
jgi:hypothetical protein